MKKFIFALVLFTAIIGIAKYTINSNNSLNLSTKESIFKINEIEKNDFEKIHSAQNHTKEKNHQINFILNFQEIFFSEIIKKANNPFFAQKHTFLNLANLFVNKKYKDFFFNILSTRSNSLELIIFYKDFRI